MNIQQPENQIDMTFVPDAADPGCAVEMPVVFISPALPEVIVEELKVLFHIAGHALKQGIELTTCYVQMDPDNNRALLDMAGAPDRRAMSLFGAQFAMKNDSIVNIAMGEAWSAPNEVLDELNAQELPEDFKISSHPAAFECYTVQVETLNGVWFGRIPISPFTGTSQTETSEEIAGQPRTYTGPLELVKLESVTDASYPPVLPEHMEAMMAKSSLPDMLKDIAREILTVKLKDRKERLEARANGEKVAADVASDAIEKASASAK